MEFIKTARITVAGCVEGNAYTETELLINLDRYSVPLQSMKASGGN